MKEFKDFVGIKKPQIISITETWGKEWIPDGIFTLQGYTMYRSDRKEKRGGGTILYIKENIDQRACRPLNEPGFESSAWCWIVEKSGKKILVGSVYRSPNSTKTNNRLLLDKIIQAYEIAGDNRLLILGDLNVPDIDWIEKDLFIDAKDIDVQVLSVVNDCFLFQHVKEHTRFRKDQSSLLDLIITKEENDVRNIEVLQPLGKSDHGIVMGEFVCEWKSKIAQKPRRMYHKGNYDKILEGLKQIDWDIVFENKSAQECWNIFKAELEKLVDEHIPMSIPKDYNEPWMNKGLMKLWKKKYFAWKRYTETKGYQRYKEYVKETKIFKKYSTKEKRLFERKIAREAKHNKRAFYRYVNSKLTVRPEITEMQNEAGELIDNDIEICNILGRYFNSVYTARSNDSMPDMNNSFNQEIRDIVITRGDVQSRLEKLNVNKSCGPDNIHPFVLQRTASEISVPLTKIFKLSLSTGECPEDWRSANVTPIHKKGDRTDPSNYRPVSLTSQSCKILESIVRKHVLEHLVSNNILSDKQHGFREGRSCLTNLLEIMEDWTEIIDKHDDIDVAYLDFRKAFDLVSHKHLIYKLSKYGITKQVLNWIEAFLNQRTQRVIVRGMASEPFDVTSGVPQGSVLGPILFLLYINDLPLEVVSPVSLFADDSKIFSKIISDKNRSETNNANGNETLQKDLNNVRNWASKWKMEFNVDKCKIMHLGKTNPKHTYTMDGSNLTITTEEKDLGVLVDDKLKFDKHIRGIVNKANRILSLIRIGFTCLDMKMFMNLYPVLVRPHLEYCVQVWSPHLEKDINLLEGVQRRATKMVPQLKNLPYEERLKKLKLTTLRERRIRGDMIETYKLITGKEDINPNKFFTIREERGDPELIRGRIIKKKQANLEPRKMTFSNKVVNYWNELEGSEVWAKTTGEFKKEYDYNEAERKKARRADIYVY